MNRREILLDKLSNINNGEMKELSADGTPVLLARVGDKCFAVGAYCTHYRAPLAEGSLVGDRITCPWHHACFDVKTGDMQDPPALDSLPSYPVRVQGEDIFVELPQKVTDRCTPPMVNRDVSDKRVFAIMGGGAAGYMAAQTLREDGFTGQIVMATREGRTPYDRPNLSKDYLAGNAELAWIPLRSDDFFEKHGIDLREASEAVKVDPAAKEVAFKDGGILKYDSILVATGGIPRTLPFQTGREKNVYLLRSFEDSEEIIAAAEKGSRAVVIGASFIGMESASSLKARGCDVTVVAPGDVPFQKVLGDEIGQLFKSIHEQNDVKFKLGAAVKGFEGDDTVRGITLGDGERIEADFVVVGVGVRPATDMLSGIELHNDGGVIADDHMRIGEDIYAAGDIVHFPYGQTGELTRIEHWRTALQQGRTAAHNMAGKPTVFDGVPFFWTRQFDETLSYVGHARTWDEIIVDGDISRRHFLAWYIKDSKVVAAAGMNRDLDLAIVEEMMRVDRTPHPDGLRAGSLDLVNMVRTTRTTKTLT